MAARHVSRRGRGQGQAGATPAVATIDVVMPVFNALDHLRECLGSLLRQRDAAVRLIVIDDGSDAPARTFLAESLAGLAQVELITLAENAGYLNAMNAGLARASADLVVMLNSDTIVFDGFFDDLRAIFRANPDIGIVNPVSVWANWTRVPFPRGHTIFSLAAKLRREHGLEAIDINNASGFCLAIRGDVLAAAGGRFDTAYDRGYWEETDLCMRVLAEGWRVAAAPGLFVFHHGWASFGAESRNENMVANERIFRGRWGEPFAAIETWWRLNDPLRAIKSGLANSDAYADNVFVEEGGAKRSVLYLLPSMKFYGGVISAVQIVNRLILEGFAANIAVLGDIDGSVLRYGACYFSPFSAADEGELLRRLPPVDLVVATHWSTAFAADALVKTGRARRAVYFVQDFEPDFYPAGSADARMAAVSYDLIRTRICKTAWLKRRLDSYGGDNHIVPLGLNTDVFAEIVADRPPRVVAMARPSSERRNWPVTRRVFEILGEQRPDLELGVFGFGFKPKELPPRVQDFGLLPSAAAVARMLNGASLLLDASTYQGFGRPGLEAMACGVVPVVTHKGGITSYAKHDFNAWLIEPLDVAGICRAISALADDGPRRRRLRQEGLATARHYSMQAEGQATAALFHQLLN